MKPYKSILSAILTATTLMTPQALPYLAQSEANSPLKTVEEYSKDRKSRAPFSHPKERRHALKHMPLDIRAVTSIESQTFSSIQKQNRKSSSVTTLQRLNEKEWEDKDIPLFEFEMDTHTRKRLPEGYGKGRTSHRVYWAMDKRDLRRMETGKTELLINGQLVKCQGHISETVRRDPKTGKLSSEDRMEIWVAVDDSINTPAVVIDHVLLPPNTVSYKRTRQIHFDGYEPRFQEIRIELISGAYTIKLDDQEIPSLYYEITERKDYRYHSSLIENKINPTDSGNISREQLWFSPNYIEAPILRKLQQSSTWVDPKTQEKHFNFNTTTVQLSFEKQNDDDANNWKPLLYKDLKDLIELDEG